MWLVGVVVRRYIDFLIILIPTPLYLFCSSITTFCSFLKMIFFNYYQRVGRFYIGRDERDSP